MYGVSVWVGALKLQLQLYLCTTINDVYMYEQIEQILECVCVRGQTRTPRLRRMANVVVTVH